MKTFFLALSTENPSLSHLTSLPYDSNFKTFDIAALQGVDPVSAKLLVMVNTALGGPEFEPEQAVFSVSAQSGAFKRMYGPIVGQQFDAEDKSTGAFILSFGSVEVPFKVGAKGVIQSSTEGVEIESQIISTEINGYDTVCMSIEFYSKAKDVLVTLNAPLRFLDREEEYKADALQAKFKRSPKAVLELLDKAPKMNSFDGETIKPTYLEIGAKYKVIGYRPMTTPNGDSFMLHIEGEEGQTWTNVELPEDQQEAQPLGTVECWANSTLKTVLSYLPIITKDQPATLVVRDVKQMKNKKWRADVGLIVTAVEKDNNEEVDLDFDFV